MAFILFTSNPFVRLDSPPFDGRDLNPLLQDGGELNKYATGLQFLPLVELDQNLNFEGMLAESITTEDNLTFTVKLYDNAVWSDGTPITADTIA